MNSMSLLRNSVIVGGATFLVGSALMEVSKGNEKVGWWPYTATFLSGALGFYLLRQQFVPVPEALELNAEYDFQNQAITTVIADNEDDAYEELALGDLADEDWEIVDIREAEELQSFSAEVFMADRKIRRRTRWTWTRGPEDGFDDKDTVPYSNYYNQTSYKGRGWRSYDVPKYLIEDSYHINDLPEGYHLHLLKPNLRKDKWLALAKSPSSDEWRTFSTKNKSELTQKLLAWYNDDIAKPEVAELSPIDKLMIQSGMASGDVQISRIETKGYKGDEYNKIQWFASGGPDRLPVIELATALGSEGAGYTDGALSVRIGSSEAQKYGVLPFLQGLLFMGHSAGTNRSVNRYNKDSAKWVKSYPAWFQNAVKNQIEALWFELEPQGNYQPRYKICNQDVVMFDPEGAEGTIDTMGGKMRGFRVRIPTSDTMLGETYYRPRPSTQRKLYEASFKMGLDGKWTFHAADLFMAICDKFKFEDLNSIQAPMTGDRLALNRTFREEDETLQNVGKLMLRRFKKN